MAVSKSLNKRELFEKTKWFADEKYDPVAQRVIDKHVRRLVLLMKVIEEKGMMPLDKIERCVVRAFEKAEYLYYGLGEHEIMQVVKMERENDKGRKGNR